MALEVGSGFLAVVPLCNEGKPNAARPPAAGWWAGWWAGCRSCPRPGAGSGSCAGRGLSSHSPPAPARQGRCLGSVAFRAPQLGACRAQCPFLPPLGLPVSHPPQPGTGCQGLPHGFAVQPRCSAASGTGKKKRVLCLWILAGPEVGALTYPSLHILSSNLQENSASLYSRCQQWAAGSRGNVTTKRETLNLLHPLHSHLYLGKVDNSSFSTSVVVFYARLAFTLPRYK